MSVSQKVKNEILLSIDALQPCCKVAFLSAVFRAAGSLIINSQGFGISLPTENYALSVFLKRAVKHLFGANCVVEKSLNSIKNKYVYSVTILDKKVLMETGIVFSEQGLLSVSQTIDRYLIEQDCCKKSFIKGLFVGCGSVAVPKSGSRSYQLEFGLANFSVATDLQKLLADIGLNFKTVLRGDKTIVYTKNSGTISDVLAFMNANNAVIWLQNMLVEKNMRNNANRQKNCITANIDRAVIAAEKQLSDIAVLEEKIGLKNLSSQLFEVAMARKENPAANMEEMAEICNISKSGVNHRMRKIAMLAQNLK